MTNQDQQAMRSMLDLAAQAAGFSLSWPLDKAAPPVHDETGQAWEPLSNIAQARALAIEAGVKYGRDTEYREAGPSMYAHQIEGCRHLVAIAAVGSEEAATCMAIVFAAALG